MAPGGTSGEREASGGIFGVTKGLLPKFGENRVIDTPISESAIIGAAGGAALAGLAAGRGAHVRRLRRRQHGPDLQPDGEVPLHVRRQDALPRGRPPRDGRGHEHGCAAFADDLPVPDRGARAQGRRPVQRARCEGSADPGDPRRRPGDVLRAQGTVPAQGRGARRAHTRSPSARRTCCARART